MDKADKIKMERLEQMVESLERENDALRKQLFKYKLKNGEIEEDEENTHVDQATMQEILEALEQYKKQQQIMEQKQTNIGRDMWESIMVESPYDCSGPSKLKR